MHQGWGGEGGGGGGVGGEDFSFFFSANFIEKPQLWVNKYSSCGIIIL